MNSTTEIEGSATEATDSEGFQGISSTNPLENSLVIDQICNFLPAHDLLMCRRVNKQWNSSAIKFCRSRPTTNHINFKTNQRRAHRVADYKQFLESRNTEVEWYLRDIKYSFDFNTWKPAALSISELSGAQWFLEQFGLRCIRSVSLGGEFGLNLHNFKSSVKEWRIGLEREALCDFVGNVLQGVHLQCLQMSVIGFVAKGVIPAIPTVLASPASVKRLELGHHSLLKCLQGCQFVNTLEELLIDVTSPSFYQILQEQEPEAPMMMPNLHHLTLRLENARNYDYSIAWPYLKVFMELGCPALTNCTIKLGNTSVRRFLEPFSNVDATVVFPKIHFNYVSDVPEVDDNEENIFSEPEIN